MHVRTCLVPESLSRHCPFRTNIANAQGKAVLPLANPQECSSSSIRHLSRPIEVPWTLPRGDAVPYGPELTNQTAPQKSTSGNDWETTEGIRMDRAPMQGSASVVSLWFMRQDMRVSRSSPQSSDVHPCNQDMPLHFRSARSCS
jgi:hypothetical protein